MGHRIASDFLWLQYQTIDQLSNFSLKKIKYINWSSWVWNDFCLAFFFLDDWLAVVSLVSSCLSIWYVWIRFKRSFGFHFIIGNFFVFVFCCIVWFSLLLVCLFVEVLHLGEWLFRINRYSTWSIRLLHLLVQNIFLFWLGWFIFKGVYWFGFRVVIYIPNFLHFLTLNKNKCLFGFGLQSVRVWTDVYGQTTWFDSQSQRTVALRHRYTIE